MGKRSNFARSPRDYYPTPMAAVPPLLPHLTSPTFTEPCAGNGALVDHFTRCGLTCTYASDIEPQRADIHRADALTASWPSTTTLFITNPPWTRTILHPLILRLSSISPTWLLFDTDWAHTTQSIPFLSRLRKIVSVGRLKWIADSAFTGKDNCAWHLFTEPSAEPPQFFGRVSGAPVADLTLDDL